MDYRKRGTLVLTSLLEDLEHVGHVGSLSATTMWACLL